MRLPRAATCLSRALPILSLGVLTSCGASNINNNSGLEAGGGGECAGASCRVDSGGLVDLNLPPPDTLRGPHVLAAIRIDPQSQVDFIDNLTPVMQPFTATGIYMDGTNSDVTAMATFTVEKAALGSFPAGVGMAAFTSTTMGGFTHVYATVGALKASTILTLVPRRVDTTTGMPLDFFFIAPYDAPTSPGSAVLAFSTNIQNADLGFVIDTTGSMGPKITSLESSLSSLASGLKAAVPSVAMGVADFKSWPCSPDGTTAEGDYPWKLDNRIITVSTTAGLTQIQNAITALAAIGGYDGPEDGFDAAWFATSGLGGSDCAGGTLAGFSGSTAPGAVTGETTGTIGGMGFRAGALPILVVASDAEFHDEQDPADIARPPGKGSAPFSPNTYAHGHDAVVSELATIGARVIGIASTCGGADFTPSIGTEGSITCTTLGSPGFEPHDQEVWLAEQTGSVVPVTAFGSTCAVGGKPMCCTGLTGAAEAPDASGNCPLVFRVDASGTGLGTALQTAIVALVNFGNLDVGTQEVGQTTDTSGAPLPGTHTTADFLLPFGALKGVLPLDAMPGVGLPGGPTSIDTAKNEFLGVKPGTTVEFTVKAYNDFIPQLTTGPQFFQATIKVIGNGVSFLDSRDVYILVPPAAIFG